MQQNMEEFNLKKPVRAALCWVGKFIKDNTGKNQENEAILLSEAPHYLEGKLLSVSKLINEDSDPTSCSQVQAEAVMEQIKEWDVEENVIALMFDNTASNTGRHRGATIRLKNCW